MPLIKPVMGKYYLKWLGERFYEPADALQCHSCHRISGESVGDLMYKNSGYVVTDFRNIVLGFIVFRSHLQEQKIHFVDLVVHPDYRHQGIGSMLVARMKQKMDTEKCILAVARESNYSGHKFMQKNDFVAYRVMPEFYVNEWAEETDIEDAFVFIYSPFPEVVEAAMRKRKRK